MRTRSSSHSPIGAPPSRSLDDHPPPIPLIGLAPADGASALARDVAWGWAPTAPGGRPMIEHYPITHDTVPLALIERLDRALAGHAVYSDFPALDAMRLDRLYAAHGRQRPFELAHFGRLVGAVADAGLVAAARTAAERHVGRRRDAAAELAIMVETLRLCRLYAG